MRPTRHGPAEWAVEQHAGDAAFELALDRSAWSTLATPAAHEVRRLCQRSHLWRSPLVEPAQQRQFVVCLKQKTEEGTNNNKQNDLVGVDPVVSESFLLPSWLSII